MEIINTLSILCNIFVLDLVGLGHDTSLIHLLFALPASQGQQDWPAALPSAVIPISFTSKQEKTQAILLFFPHKNTNNKPRQIKSSFIYLNLTRCQTAGPHQP